MSGSLTLIPALRGSGFTLSLKDLLAAGRINGQLQKLIRQVVEEQIIVDEAKREGISVGDEELQKAADSYRQQQGLQSADATQQWLQDHHLSLDDFERAIELALLRNKVAEKVAGLQIERYFAENRGQFDRARLSQILVEKEGVADELLSQIQEDGEDFTALARKHSLDQGSAKGGGYLGAVGRDRMTSAMEAAVFGASEGAVVGPFKTRDGFHLLRVEEILPAELDEAAKQSIRDLLFGKWLSARIEQAQVEELIWDLLGEEGAQ